MRKFPGPAGLINPDRPCLAGDKRRVPAGPGQREKKKKAEKRREELSEEGDLGQCFTWRKALEELRALGQDSEVLQFNTDWIRSQTRATPVGFKIPFFLGKIVNMDTDHRDPRVILLDDHGKIHGSVHRDVLETYSLDIRPGTVLLVMKAAVLTTDKKTHINITLNNLVAIYSYHHKVRSHQNVSVDQMRATAEEVERQRVEEEEEIARTAERLPQPTPQPVFTPAMPPPSVNRNHQPQPSQAFTPMMRTVSRDSGSAVSPVFSTVGTPFSSDQPGFSPDFSRNSQLSNSLRSNNTLSPATPTLQTRARPPLTPRLPSLHLSPPSPSSPSQPSPSVGVEGAGRPKFVFKPRSSPSTASLASTQASQLASQQIVNSLMSDLDTSDIWGDF